MMLEKTSRASFDQMETRNSRYLSGALRKRMTENRRKDAEDGRGEGEEEGRSKFLAGLSPSKWLDESL